jgi:TM2 domain-containing membrane protein YozV
MPNPDYKQPEQFNKLLAAALAFLLGIIGADFFYRRKFSAGFAVFAVLILAYALMPMMQQASPSLVALLRQIPTILVLYGWVRAFMYTRDKGL